MLAVLDDTFGSTVLSAAGATTGAGAATGAADDRATAHAPEATDDDGAAAHGNGVHCGGTGGVMDGDDGDGVERGAGSDGAIEPFESDVACIAPLAEVAARTIDSAPTAAVSTSVAASVSGGSGRGSSTLPDASRPMPSPRAFFSSLADTLAASAEF